MERMDMVEMLREKANITYEEAKTVLDEANGDLLDAMILLERRGKVQRPETDIAPFMKEDTADEDTTRAKAEDAAQEATAKKTGDNKTVRKATNTMKKIINVLKKHHAFLLLQLDS